MQCLWQRIQQTRGFEEAKCKDEREKTVRSRSELSSVRDVTDGSGGKVALLYTNAIRPDPQHTTDCDQFLRAPSNTSSAT